MGVGGAGMSSIALMLKAKGKEVFGVDRESSDLLDFLAGEGISVRIGSWPEAVVEGTGLILSDAIQLDEPEVLKADQLGLPIFRRSQALGWLLGDKKVIAITGTHGKTTTSAMVAMGLKAAGMDPTIIVGAKVPQLGGSIIEGKDDWAVVEACEAYESYLDLDPYIAVLTNLEPDHLDYHENWENLQESMKKFMAKVPKNGRIFASGEEGEWPAAEHCSSGLVTEYLEDDWSRLTGGKEMFLTGRHNRMNAAGALMACIAAGADSALAAEGIASFTGADRRMQTIYSKEAVVIDDYAHLPTEIRATIQAVREKHRDNRLIAVFQPHLYSRTAEHLADFSKALDEADLVVVTDIFPAREDPIPGVSSVRIAEGLTKPHFYVPSRFRLARRLKQLSQPGDVFLIMGAGNISEVPSQLAAELERPARTGRVAVFMGGESAEREVSIHSGRAVKAALIRLGFEPVEIDPAHIFLKSGSLGELMGPNRPDCALLPIHGPLSEDGSLQGVLDLLHIPYSSPGLLATALAMDKDKAKEILANAGVEVPKGILVKKGDSIPAIDFAKAVVKPNKQGSTVGLTFIEGASQLAEAIDLALRYDDSCLVEELIEGIEISCPVMGDKALLPVEIRPKTGGYDFANKYTPGATDEPCPPVSLSQQQIEASREIALKAHRALGCRGLTRTDMIVTPERIVALEVNTQPGMTETSLVRKSAAAVGISFDELVNWMVEDALAQEA